jgi:hypothetical protein
MPVAQALTPALALDYVSELSADVRAVVVLDAAGRLLAGPPRLADPARALVAAAGTAREAEAVSAQGVVCVVLSPAHAMLAVCGRFAIAGVIRADLRAALAALEGRPLDAADAPIASEATADRALERAADALVSAVQRGFET